MADRYDLISFRETATGKTFAVRVGQMVAKQSGDGFTLYFDALPIPNKDGKVTLTAAVPRDRDGGAPARARPEPARDDGPDDTIPF